MRGPEHFIIFPRGRQGVFVGADAGSEARLEWVVLVAQ